MQAEFNPKTGSISFRDPGIPGTQILQGVSWVRYRTGSGRQQQAYLADHGGSIHEEAFEDVHGTGSLLIIHRPASLQGIELTYRINTYTRQPFALLHLALRNLSREPIYLQEFCPFQADPGAGGRVHISDPVGEMRFFKLGGHGWGYTGLRTGQGR